MSSYDDPKKRITLSGKPADPACEHTGAPQPIDPATGQHKDYWVLSAEERAKGFVRPLRRSYIHNKCGVETHMGLILCETYARDPSFYGATFCCGCREHFPLLNPDGSRAFHWAEDGKGVGE